MSSVCRSKPSWSRTSLCSILPHQVSSVFKLCLACVTLVLDCRHLLSHNLVMKHIPGADPELVLLNHYYEELDVSPLHSEFFVLVLTLMWPLQVSKGIVDRSLSFSFLMNQVRFVFLLWKNNA